MKPVRLACLFAALISMFVLAQSTLVPPGKPSNAPAGADLRLATPSNPTPMLLETPSVGRKAGTFKPAGTRREAPQQSGLNFASAVTYLSGGHTAMSVAVADVNLDGIPDLLVANNCVSNSNCSSGTVAVLLGNGDGTFQTAVPYGSGGFVAYSVAVADVNGDGNPDLLVANNCVSKSNCGNGTVAVLLGNGNGTFQAAVPYGSGGNQAMSVAVADVTGDGYPDLLVANYCASTTNCDNGTVAVLLGNGDGTFQPAVPYASGGYGANSVAVAVLNGNGNPEDLVLANNCVSSSNCSNGTVSVLLGNGDGTFQTAVPYGSGGVDAYSVAVADVNADGNPDLLVANDCPDCPAGGTVGVLLGNGNGTFQTAAAYGSGGWESYSVAVSDVNGDGNPDVVVANWCASTDCSNGSAGVLLGNGNGTFQTAVAFSSGDFYAASLAVADLNGDGKPDLVLANSCAGANNCATGSAGVLLNTSLTPTSTALTSSPNPSSFAQSVTFTATVTPLPGFDKGTPTGIVNFYDGTTNIGNSNLNNSGVATLTTSTLALGVHKITAVYSGDANFLGSTSPLLKQFVNKSSTATALTSSPNPSNYGQQVTFTATVSGTYGGTPTGTVSFYNNGTLMANENLANGVAHYRTSSLAKGKHTIKATYQGNSDYQGSSGHLVQSVN